jgi:hypothetical protein
MNIIQTCVAQGIQNHPEAAAREVPQILGHYIVDNDRLNAVYTAAKQVLIQPDRFNLTRLAEAVARAENRP